MTKFLYVAPDSPAYGAAWRGLVEMLTRQGFDGDLEGWRYKGSMIWEDDGEMSHLFHHLAHPETGREEYRSIETTLMDAGVAGRAH